MNEKNEDHEVGLGENPLTSGMLTCCREGEGTSSDTSKG